MKLQQVEVVGTLLIREGTKMIFGEWNVRVKMSAWFHCAWVEPLPSLAIKLLDLPIAVRVLLSRLADEQANIWRQRVNDRGHLGRICWQLKVWSGFAPRLCPSTPASKASSPNPPLVAACPPVSATSPATRPAPVNRISVFTSGFSSVAHELYRIVNFIRERPQDPSGDTAWDERNHCSDRCGPSLTRSKFFTVRPDTRDQLGAIRDLSSDRREAEQPSQASPHSAG